jgi:hypothetical protein
VPRRQGGRNASGQNKTRLVGLMLKEFLRGLLADKNGSRRVRI